MITSTESNDYILIGDMNFNYDIDVHPHCLFINLIDSFSLIQHIPNTLYWSCLDLVGTPIFNILPKPRFIYYMFTSNNIS